MIIGRLRSWYERPQKPIVLSPAPAAGEDLAGRIAELEKRLSDETFLSKKLGDDVDRLTKQLTNEQLRRAVQVARIETLQSQLRARPVCECGGDAELYWRTRANTAEQFAALDRANVVRLENLLAVHEGRPVIGSLE